RSRDPHQHRAPTTRRMIATPSPPPSDPHTIWKHPDPPHHPPPPTIDQMHVPRPRALTLPLNGAQHDLNIHPQRTLLNVLRNELGLTGAKYGCGEGQCGACTVLLDGAAVRTCTMPVRNATEREIRTIEGLADRDRLHPVQRAFMEEGAMQCGYCT